MGELLLVVAKYEFSPALSDKNMLELKSGDKMVVLDKVCKHFPISFECPPALDIILSCLFFFSGVREQPGKVESYQR